MDTNFDDKRKTAYSGRRSIMDYGMGAIIAGFGIFFLVADKWEIAFNIDKEMRYAFAGLCLLYGGFRIYRGYKKNYFKE